MNVTLAVVAECGGIKLSCQEWVVDPTVWSVKVIPPAKAASLWHTVLDETVTLGIKLLTMILPAFISVSGHPYDEYAISVSEIVPVAVKVWDGLVIVEVAPSPNFHK